MRDSYAEEEGYMINRDSQSASKAYLIACLMASAILGGCSLIPESEFLPPKPLSKSGDETTSENNRFSHLDDERVIQAHKRFQQTPKVSLPNASVSLLDDSSQLFSGDGARDISLAVDGLPIPVFINEVFANRLKLDFQMAPEVADKQDLVSLRISEPRSKAEIFEVSQGVLESYGVLIVQQGDLLRFTLGKRGQGSGEVPLIVSGEALPSVPSSHRPVFVVHSLAVISNSDAYSMLKAIFERQKLSIERDNARNAVRLKGASDLVKSAVEVLKAFDVPSMKGRHSLRIEPLYAEAEDLAERLKSTLSAQGYDVGGVGNTTTLVPINELNALFAFATTPAMIDLIKKWVVQLDKPVTRSDGEGGFFWYQVQNTSAADLADTLNAVLSGSQAPSKGGSVIEADSSKNGSVRKQSGDFVVDPARNVLLYKGAAARWQETLPLIRDLDKAPPQVLVEVIVAEVSLTESFKFGVEWGLSNQTVKDATGNLTSIFGPSGIGSAAGGNGLSWTSLSSSGATRLALNAFANDNNVSVLQTPKILVRSGEAANVSVGQSIPTLTSSTATDAVVGGDSAITQQVVYRDVGISLTVTPTVFSDGRIDMQVAQEVSQNITDQSSATLTPIISTRKLETSLSLQDGGSVLLGGLITKTQSKGNSRVPLLGSIPILGHLFRTDSTSADTTELMILIAPYVVKDGRDAQALTRAFSDQLQLHPK
ncbi:MAG: hypothetical protein K6L73_04280 [Cellvibrionaceae bacterium]